MKPKSKDNYVKGACEILGVKEGEIFYAGACLNPHKIVDDVLLIKRGKTWKEPRLRTLKEIVERKLRIVKEDVEVSPCKFCGSEDVQVIYEQRATYKLYRCQCSKCGAKTRWFTQVPAMAKALWNEGVVDNEKAL